MRDAGCFDHLFSEPSMEQLYNKFAAVKKNLNPQPKISTTHDMRQYIINHLQEPEDETEGFIPFHEIKDESVDNLRFSICFASKRSISRYIKIYLMHIYFEENCFQIEIRKHHIN